MGRVVDADGREWERGPEPPPPRVWQYTLGPDLIVEFTASALRHDAEWALPPYRDGLLVAADAIEAGEHESAAAILRGLGMRPRPGPLPSAAVHARIAAFRDAGWTVTLDHDQRLLTAEQRAHGMARSFQEAWSTIDARAVQPPLPLDWEDWEGQPFSGA